MGISHIQTNLLIGNSYNSLYRLSPLLGSRMTIDTSFEKPDILMNEEIVSSFMKINGKTNSAASSMAVARDVTNTGILALRGR